MEQKVNRAKENAGKDQVATAYPNHSTISPKKLAQETSSNIPPKENTVSIFNAELNSGIRRFSLTRINLFKNMPGSHFSSKILLDSLNDMPHFILSVRKSLAQFTELFNSWIFLRPIMKKRFFFFLLIKKLNN